MNIMVNNCTFDHKMQEAGYWVLDAGSLNFLPKPAKLI